MSLQTDLQAAVAKVTADGALLHDIVHGDAAATVITEAGPVKTVAKAIADIEASLDGSRVELDQQVAAAAASATAAADSASDAAASARVAVERAGKIPDPAPANAFMSVRVNGAGDAYELVPGGGDVVGPADATDGDLVRFDGATGKLLKTGGKILAADITAGILGTVAAKDAGIAPGQVPAVQADGRLPASVMPPNDGATLFLLSHGF